MRRRRHRPPPSPISRSAIALIPFSPSLAALPEGAGEAAAPPNPRPSEEDRASRSQMRSATPHPHDPGHAPLIHPPPPSILRKSHRDVEALLTDRTHLEAVVKIQQEFWLHRDGVLRDRLDETRRVEDCLRRGDAAKLDLLLGKKDLEVRRHRIYIGLIGEIYDDMSLPNGVLRLQRKGGHGRHNGSTTSDGADKGAKQSVH